jgi:ApaG protein
MYRAVMHAIEVKVTPRYVPEESAPENGRYVWAYTVEIVNMGPETVQLRHRYWHITDATGAVQEVRGEGVVGKQPVLPPGESFSYTSACPLSTPGGIMKGHYDMISETGRRFTIEIPAFSLDLPQQARVLH